MRPAAHPLSVALDAHRVLQGPRPEWLTEAAWEALQEATKAVLADAGAVVAAEGVRRAARSLACGPRTLSRAKVSGAL